MTRSSVVFSTRTCQATCSLTMFGFAFTRGIHSIQAPALSQYRTEHHAIYHLLALYHISKDETNACLIFCEQE
jgi:hypothetical protein